MSHPEKEKRKRSSLIQSPDLLPKPGSTLIPSLPNDMLVSCFARIPIFYYRTLSLVSKTFRSLIASPELYESRLSLGNTENRRLYVCLRLYPDPYPRWFTLCRHKPDTSKNKKSSGYVLSEISTNPKTPLSHRSGLVAVGSNIYNIHPRSSRHVSILDCLSNTWRKGPSRQIKRNHPKVNVLDGKIYVAGGCKDCNSTNIMEVFDPETQTWELVSSPLAEIYIEKSVGIDGKMYVFGNNKGFVYEQKEGKWENMSVEMDLGWVWNCCCVIENVIYCYNINGEFKWYDTEVRVWKVLKGVKGLPKLPLDGVKLADYGGKMAVLWEKISAESEYNENKVILCAVVEFERFKTFNSEEIWGEVEWYDEVLTVPKSYTLEYALTATV